MAYIGHLLIAAAGTGMGLWMAHRLSARSRFLEQADRLLQAVEQQIAYTAEPMDAVWRRLTLWPNFRSMPLLVDTVSGLDSGCFSSAFSAAVESAAERGLLTEEGRCLLLEFGEGCGGYDLAGQCEHIRHYRGRIARLQQQTAADAAVRGRLYRVMGVSVGTALALMLM